MKGCHFLGESFIGGSTVLSFLSLAVSERYDSIPTLKGQLPVLWFSYLRLTCSFYPSFPDFLGYVEVNLFSASRKHQTQLGVTEMQLKNQHLPLRDGKGTLTVDFELKWEESADPVS